MKKKIQDKVAYVFSKNTTQMPVGVDSWQQFKKGYYLNIHDPTKVNVGINYNVIVKDNTPIKNIELINPRSVLIDNKYFYSVDPNFIADLAFNALVDKNKKINGEFIFYKKSGSYKLIRIGSEEHNRIDGMIRRSNLKKISKKDFIVGTVYTTPANKKYLYLGNVDTISMPWRKSNGDYEKKMVKNKPLFYRLYTNQDGSAFTLDKDNINNLIYRLEIKNSHSFVESLNKINIENSVIDKIKKISIDSFKEYLSTMSNQIDKSYFYWEYKKYSQWINLHPANSPQFKEFDVEKYMLFA